MLGVYECDWSYECVHVVYECAWCVCFFARVYVFACAYMFGYARVFATTRVEFCECVSECAWLCACVCVFVCECGAYVFLSPRILCFLNRVLFLFPGIGWKKS